MSLLTYKNWFESHFDGICKDYCTFLEFQSISTDPAYKEDVKKCASWLSRYLEDLGLDVQKWDTVGSPVIFGKKAAIKNNRPTLLIYHHYDVQPVDPLELWESPPFEPRVKDGVVYARGAADNKGQCFYSITAIKAFLELEEKMGVNIKLLIEGEEECGSHSLPKLLEEKKEELQADYLLIVDVDMPGENQPGITLGARGIVTFDLECTASNLDLHSGSFGGMVMNPNRALADVLAKCYEENGSVAIPGFYEGITPLTKKERGDLFQDMDTEKVFQEFGIRAKICEEGFSTVESNWIRPTLEINGMQGGYTGSGIKTIIPAKAVAKLSCRLVPGQDPKEIGELVAQFLKKNIAQGIEIKIEIGGYGKSVRVPFESKIVEVVSTAFEDVYKDKCVKTLCGGSIPISADLEKISGAKTLLMGVGLAEDGIHAPNEHFGLDRLKQGFLVMTRIFELLSNG